MNHSAHSDTDQPQLPDLTAKCDDCIGICCVAPSFEKSTEFAFSKPALTACAHLDQNNRCKIYRNLDWHGFTACGAFDCKGAGQYLSQVIYPNQSWRDNPDTKKAMAETYRRLRRVHDLLEIYVLAKSLPLDDTQEQLRQTGIKMLAPENGWTAERLALAEENGIFALAQKNLRAFQSAYARQ